MCPLIPWPPRHDPRKRLLHRDPPTASSFIHAVYLYAKCTIIYNIIYRTNCRREGATHAAAASPFFVTIIYNNIIFCCSTYIGVMCATIPVKTARAQEFAPTVTCSSSWPRGGVNGSVTGLRGGGDEWPWRGEHHLRGGIALSRIIIYYIIYSSHRRCRLTRDLLHVPRSISEDTIERWIFDSRRSMRVDSHAVWTHGFPIINHSTFWRLYYARRIRFCYVSRTNGNCVQYRWVRVVNVDRTISL